MKKFFVLLALVFFVYFFAPPVFAEDPAGGISFEAKVLEVLESKEDIPDDGVAVIRQKLKLLPLNGSQKGEEIIFDGTMFEVLSSAEYEKGDVVLVDKQTDENGNAIFFVTGFARAGAIYWLAAAFALLVIAVGRLKGLRALVVLGLSFAVILKFIIPQILLGGNPLLISITGSLFILFLVIYITEGFRPVSHVAVFSIAVSLGLTAAISVFFVNFAKLNGFASEEVLLFASSAYGSVNLRGLLLAGIIIGALGVLDDVVISQVALIDELKKTNPKLSKKEIYKKGMNVGVSHLSSMVNTLFLAYAGAALPLLLLFSLNVPGMPEFGHIINNEVLATEIVRTLAGSAGLIFAVPISTFFAAYFLRGK